MLKERLMSTEMSMPTKKSSNLTRHLNQLNALYSITQVISASFGHRQMLHEVLDVLSDSLGLCRGVIMLTSMDSSELLVEAAGSDESHTHNKDIRYRRGEGITGRVLETGQPVIIPRIADEPEFRSRIHPRRKDIARDFSFICVPITLGTEVVGTLAADVPFEDTECLKENQRFLSIVAAMISNDAKNRRMILAEKQTLAEENVRLHDALRQQYQPENIIGNSNSMRNVYRKIQQVAVSDSTALIRGETGTGKELVASAIHYASNRSKKPFVKVNCAALNENLLESELFGHEKGAFTGAVNDRLGRLDEANGGTLFLDEIGDFSPTIQIKLLRVLQEREFQRVGSNQTIKTDVRIIAATNRDLEELVRNDTFRADFFYRINVFPILLPPLRKRKDDILLLLDRFVEDISRRMNKVIHRVSTTAINMMMSYHWPGNVRELENCVEHAILLSNDQVIHGYHLPATLQTPEQTDIQRPGKLKGRVNLLERDMIIDSLKRNNGRISGASAELGITQRMLRYKIKNLNINYKKYFRSGSS
jgi:Nif-specific regulatory protein